MSKTQLQLEDALAVKFRPDQFSKIVGNDKNIQIVHGYFSRRKFVKAWLLCGETGSGKTTMARVMAMAINCENLDEESNEPCLKCSSCKLALAGTHPDIKELNAGSEEGRVAGIESVVETIRYKPRYTAKIIIVDEAHLMSNKAAQSLLKVLEEPPQMVMWILATTDLHKLPQAILGRCQKLHFEYPEARTTAKLLLKTIKAEYGNETAQTIKQFLVPLSEACSGQVRKSLSVAESMAHIILGNPDIETKKLKLLFKDLLVKSGDLQTMCIQYNTHLLAKRYATPLSMTLELEATRIEEFLSLATRHAHYAAAYFTYSSEASLGLKEFAKVRQKFYGVQFYQFDEALKNTKKILVDKRGLSDTEISRRAIAIGAGLIDSMEKVRLGVISKEQALLCGINSYISSIEKSEKG